MGNFLNWEEWKISKELIEGKKNSPKPDYSFDSWLTTAQSFEKDLEKWSVESEKQMKKLDAEKEKKKKTKPTDKKNGSFDSPEQKELLKKLKDIASNKSKEKSDGDE